VASHQLTNCQSLLRVVGWAWSCAIRSLSALALPARLDPWFNFLSLVTLFCC
jgi:hypothetical protein